MIALAIHIGNINMTYIGLLIYILNTDLECTYINTSTLDIIEIIILLRVLEHHVFE